MKDESAYLYEFGCYRLDPVRRILRRGAEPVALTSRAFDTLFILIQNSGQTLEKDALIEKVWGDAIVEENNLTQCISVLRKALGEGRSDHRFIVTVPGRGYRFVAEVKPVRAEAENSRSDIGDLTAPAEADHEIPTSEGKNPGLGIKDFRIKKSKIKIGGWLAVAAILALAIMGAELYWGASKRRARVPAKAAASVPSRPRTMLAVLPFENLTGDPKQDYFSDGFTEEIITRLGRADPDHLGVIARTSVMRYKRSDESIRRIAKDLGVEYVVEGSVRRSGNQVRVSTQLIRASDQTHLAWIHGLGVIY